MPEVGSRATTQGAPDLPEVAQGRRKMGMLDGVRILDLSRLLPGPACTWMLHGMGARVDRVEAPSGDFARSVPPYVDGAGAIFAATHRGKRSLGLDLRKPAAIQTILTMVPRYDVLVEGFKPGVLEEMGLGPAVLQGLHPRLVIARLSGWGQTGTLRDLPGHDINYVGVAGLLSGTGSSAGPAVPFAQVADLSGATVGAMGICAALVEAQRTGRGRVLDVSLAEAALAMTGPMITMSTAEGRDPTPGGELLTGMLPVYGTYRCADGKWITVGALEPKFQALLAGSLGVVSRPELKAVFATEPRDVWVARLAEACVGPVLAPSEIAGFPLHVSRGAAARVGSATFVKAPFADRVEDGPVPSLGQHTDEILRDAGFAPEAIAALRQGGAAV